MSFKNKVDYYYELEIIKEHLNNKKPSLELHLECNRDWIPFISCPRKRVSSMGPPMGPPLGPNVLKGRNGQKGTKGSKGTNGQHGPIGQKGQKGAFGGRENPSGHKFSWQKGSKGQNGQKDLNGQKGGFEGGGFGGGGVGGKGNNFSRPLDLGKHQPHKGPKQNISGPIYYMVKEIAILLNARNRLSLMPVMLREIEDIDDTSKLVGPVGFIEAPKIVYISKSNHQFKLSLISAFDSYIWMLILASLSAIIAVNAMGDHKNIWYIIWIYVSSILNAHSGTYTSHKKSKILLAVWYLAIFVLINHFTFDLLTLMSLRVEDTVIDSWTDLCKRKDVTKALMHGFPGLSERYSLKNIITSIKNVPVGACIWKKTQINEYKGEDVMLSVKNGSTALFSLEDDLLKMMNKWQENITNLHLSREVRDRQLIYIKFESWEDSNLIKFFNKINKRFDECGFHQFWVQNARKQYSPRFSQVKYQVNHNDITLDNVKQAFYVYLFCMGFTLIPFLFELIIIKIYKARIKCHNNQRLMIRVRTFPQI